MGWAPPTLRLMEKTTRLHRLFRPSICMGPTQCSSFRCSNSKLRNNNLSSRSWLNKRINWLISKFLPIYKWPVKILNNNNKSKMKKIYSWKKLHLWWTLKQPRKARRRRMRGQSLSSSQSPWACPRRVKLCLNIVISNTRGRYWGLKTIRTPAISLKSISQIAIH